MLKKIKNLFVEEEGQALVEYGLLVGLLAVAVIATLLLLGPEIDDMFDRILTQLEAIV
ncbi:Flp family type IVb pilin [Neobacillus niacini]|uniref:Flp family type IVb pilin n=1 Tax=Neobacillus niacini TaxID=86668 RepID=UPI002FFD61C0